MSVSKLDQVLGIEGSERHSELVALDQMLGIEGARDGVKDIPREIEVDEEVSGEIIDTVEVEEQKYYVVLAENEATGREENVLVPVGDSMYDVGDEITAIHNGDSVEIDEPYGVER